MGLSKYVKGFDKAYNSSKNLQNRKVERKSKEDIKMHVSWKEMLAS